MMIFGKTPPGSSTGRASNWPAALLLDSTSRLAERHVVTISRKVSCGEPCNTRKGLAELFAVLLARLQAFARQASGGFATPSPSGGGQLMGGGAGKGGLCSKGGGKGADS